MIVNVLKLVKNRSEKLPNSSAVSQKEDLPD